MEIKNRKKFIASIIIFVICFNMTNCALIFGRLPATITLSGYIKEDGTNAVIKTAYVDLWTISLDIFTFGQKTYFGSTTTNNDGYYSFTGIPSLTGKDLLVSKSGYYSYNGKFEPTIYLTRRPDEVPGSISIYEPDSVEYCSNSKLYIYYTVVSNYGWTYQYSEVYLNNELRGTYYQSSVADLLDGTLVHDLSHEFKVKSYFNSGEDQQTVTNIKTFEGQVSDGIGLQWYNPPSVPDDLSDFYSDDEWTQIKPEYQEYYDWLQANTFSIPLVGENYPENVATVSFGPQSYMQTGSYYDLDYYLNVRASTDIGTPDGSIQPALATTLSGFSYTRSPSRGPMEIEKIEVKTEFVDDQPDGETDNRVEIHDGGMNILTGNYDMLNSWTDGISDSRTWFPYFKLGNLVEEFSYRDTFGGFPCWEEYGTDTGVIEILQSDTVIQEIGSVHNGGMCHITNIDGSNVGLRGWTILFDEFYNEWGYWPNELLISFDGKGNLPDLTGDTAGVDILINYRDGTHEWFFPEDMKIKSEEWNQYQILYQPGKQIESIKPYVINYVEGEIWVKDLYINPNKLSLTKTNEWSTGTYKDTYEEWKQGINPYTEHILTSILGLLISSIPLPPIIPLAWAAYGYISPFLPDYVSPYNKYAISGNDWNPEMIQEFDLRGPIYDNSDSHVFATDCFLKGYYRMLRTDLEAMKHRKMKITVTVYWGAMMPTYFDGHRQVQCETVDSAETSFFIDCSSFKWC